MSHAPTSQIAPDMRIHLLSDLHNEFKPFEPQVHDADVVILAGDIDVKGRAIAWAREVFTCPVLYVPGNHEYYGGHLTRTLEKLRAEQDDKVRVLDRDEVVIGKVRFLGATLWTDFSATGNQPVAAFTAQNGMNDFRKIRTGEYRRLRPNDLKEESVQSRNWLRAKLGTAHDGPTVVITHHAPSLRSLANNPRAGGHMDAAYANRYEDLLNMGADLWVHGHSHVACDYREGTTRVVCNPRGYPGEKTGWSADLILTLE